MTGFQEPVFLTLRPSEGGKSNETMLCLFHIIPYPDKFLTLTDFGLELDLADFTRSVAVGSFPGKRLIMRHFASHAAAATAAPPGHVGDDERAAAADHYGNRNAVAIVCV